MTNENIYRGILLFIIFLAASIKAQANSDQEITLSINRSLQFTYDSFSGLPATERLTIQAKRARTMEDGTAPSVQNIESNPRQFKRRFGLKISPSNATAFTLLSRNKSSLPIEIRPLKESPFQFNNNMFQNTIILNSSLKEIIDYQFIIPESIYADTGEYTLDIEIYLVDLENKNQISNKISTQIKAKVIAKLQTNLAGTRGNFKDGKSYAVLDFEELTSGESKTVFIQVRGNALAKININSENSGKMVHQQHSHLFVPYSVNVDGENSSLSTPLVIPRRPAKNLNGSAYPMKVIIGDVTNKHAGIYKDIIHIDVTLQ